MLIGSAALAIDVGSLYLDRRKLQGIADAAALAAAGRPGEEQAAAERIIAANCDCGIHIAELTSGTYTPDIAIQAERRSAAGGHAPKPAHDEMPRRRDTFISRFCSTADAS